MKKTKSYQKYPNTLKRKVAEEYLSGKFSYAVGAEEYNLPNRSVVKDFVRWYRKNVDIEQMQEQEQSFLGEEPSDQIEIAAIESQKELAALQRELAKAKLKIAGLEAMIDVAEKELQIDIRKKSGTKPSN